MLCGCFSIAARVIRTSQGREEVLGPRLSEDRKLILRALERPGRTSDDALLTCMQLIHRWLEKGPASRWSAWSDIEELTWY